VFQGRLYVEVAKAASQRTPSATATSYLSCGDASPPRCSSVGTGAVPVSAAAAVVPASAAAAAATQTAPTRPTGSQQQHNRRNETRGYQVLLWGPRRTCTTIAQVQLAGKDVLSTAQQGLPCDLLSGKGRWLRKHAALFDLPASVVCQLTAGRVGAIKYYFRVQLHWRTVLLFDGNVITSTPEAYQALQAHPRQRVLYFTRPALSNQFLALEPGVEWYEDAALDTFSDSESDTSDSCTSQCSTDQRQPRHASHGRQRPSLTASAIARLQQQLQQQSDQQPLQQRQPLQQQQPQQQHASAAARRHRNAARRPVQPDRGLKLGVLNPTHMPRGGEKLAEIRMLLEQHNVDIMGFPETHEAEGARLPMDLIPGYKYYSKARVGGSGGGVGVAVHACLSQSVKPFTFSNQQYSEAFWLVMQRQGAARKMYIGALYMPDISKPQNVRENAYELLQQDLQFLASKGAVVVMGDFNARVGRATAPTEHIGMHGEQDINANGRLLLSMLSAVDLYALNARAPACESQPDAHLTYVKRSEAGQVLGASLIDYIIATPDVAMPVLNTANSGALVADPVVSRTDHLPVLATVNRPVLRRSVNAFRLKLNADPHAFRVQNGEVSPEVAAFHAALDQLGPAFDHMVTALKQQTAASQVSAAEAVQQAHEKLLANIKQAVMASFGYKKVWVGKSMPWWTQELTAAVNARSQAFQHFRESGQQQDWAAYQQLRRNVHQLVVAAKAQHKQHRSAAITQAFNQRLNDDSVLGEKDMWQLIHLLCPKHVADRAYHSIRHPEGSTATSSAEKAAAFACHYQRLGSHDVFSSKNPQFDNVFMHDVQCNVQMHLLESEVSSSTDSCPLNAPITRAEVETCMWSLASNKAGNPAEEGIVNEVLKHGGSHMADMLLQYCSLMWQLERVHHVPGTVISIPKSGDLSDPGNYRGITLLSVLYKFYTSILNKRLVAFAEGTRHTCSHRDNPCHSRWSSSSRSNSSSSSNNSSRRHTGRIHWSNNSSRSPPGALTGAAAAAAAAAYTAAASLTAVRLNTAPGGHGFLHPAQCKVSRVVGRTRELGSGGLLVC